MKIGKYELKTPSLYNTLCAIGIAVVCCNAYVYHKVHSDFYQARSCILNTKEKGNYELDDLFETLSPKAQQHFLNAMFVEHPEHFTPELVMDHLGEEDLEYVIRAGYTNLPQDAQQRIGKAFLSRYAEIQGEAVAGNVKKFVLYGARRLRDITTLPEEDAPYKNLKRLQSFFGGEK